MKSQGFKRLLVTWLAMLADLLRPIPGMEQYVVILDQYIGLLGGAAVGHAAAAGTVGEEKTATLVAVVYVVIALASWIPALQPLLPVLYKMVSVLSVSRAAIGIHKNIS